MQPPQADARMRKPPLRPHPLGRLFSRLSVATKK